MEHAKKILICPLNWGLGHASRCIPLIRHLLKQGKEVVIASDGLPLQLLKNEFPQLTFVYFPSYNIRYSKGQSQVLAMLRSFPSIVKGIWKEHKQLKKLIAEYQIDTVLSDNRFGLWNKQIRSIYMTHQLMVKMPHRLRFLEPVVWRIHRSFIHQYDVCLIPDEEANGGFAGNLTHRYPLPRNARFIGILSRFSQKADVDNNIIGRYKIIAIISGIEPQRTLFENILVKALADKEYDSLIVQGLPQKEQQWRQKGHLSIVSHLTSEEIEQHLRQVPAIICRSGYSSIMDLIALGRTALLVPTPGQTEQEYLADYLNARKLFTSVKQEKLQEVLKDLY
jgi:uncharacterized protein (TIGR00661 family)